MAGRKKPELLAAMVDAAKEAYESSGSVALRVTSSAKRPKLPTRYSMAVVEKVLDRVAKGEPLVKACGLSRCLRRSAMPPETGKVWVVDNMGTLRAFF